MGPELLYQPSSLHIPFDIVESEDSVSYLYGMFVQGASSVWLSLSVESGIRLIKTTVLPEVWVGAGVPQVCHKVCLGRHRRFSSVPRRRSSAVPRAFVEHLVYDGCCKCPFQFACIVTVICISPCRRCDYFFSSGNCRCETCVAISPCFTC